MASLLSNIGNAIGSAYHTVTSDLGNIVSGVDNYFQSALKAPPVQQATQQATSLLHNYLNSQYQNNLKLTSAPNPFQNLTPANIATSFVNAFKAQPLINSNILGIGPLGYTPYKPATLGQYVEGQIVNPIKSGISDIQKPGLLNKGLGALSVVGGAFGATPPGLIFNTGVGAVSGALRSLRTGANLNESINSAMTTPTSLATTGLGVKNPWLALAVDVLATRNPKSAVKDIGAIKNVVTDLKGSKNALEDIATNPEAKQQLINILHSKDQLVKQGIMSAEQADKTSIKKAAELLQWDQKSAQNALDMASYYAEEKKGNFLQAFKQWIGERDAAKTTGYQVGSKFKEIPANIGPDVIKLIENPKAQVSAAAAKYIPGIRKEYDTLFAQAKSDGLDISYLKNYITHIWNKPPDVVEQLYRAAKQKFNFAKERTYPTYEEGIQMGLTPKYTQPAQILAEYTTKLEQTKANIKFFETLKKEGLIVDAAVGHGKSGFSPITGPGFPTSVSKNYEDKIVQGHYYAPTELANTINNLFAPESTDMLNQVVSKTAQLSSKLQDIHLAGGIGPLNAFSLDAGLQREFLAGRIAKPIVDFLRSFSSGATEKFFNDHINTIKELQLHNIPVNTSLKTSNLADYGFIKNTFGQGIGHAWNAVFNNPTFERFLPSLMINFYEDIKNSALKGGIFRKPVDEVTAQEIAAKATKMFYGVTTSDTAAMQNKLWQDTLSTVAFAPKFRAQMLNFWANNVKAISPVKLENGRLAANNPLSLENQNNTRFVIGSLVSYLLMDKLNYALVGNHLLQNPTGYEGDLLIPVSKITGDNTDKTVIRIPFLPSLATVPRTLGQIGLHTAQGNGPQVLKDTRGLTSTLLQGPIGLATNEDYFGNPIYGPGAQGALPYLYQQYTHPFLGALSEQGFLPFGPKNKPPILQTVTKGLELPIKYTTTDKINSSYYYANRDSVLNNLTPEERKVFDTLHQKSDGTTRQTMLRAQLRLQYPQIVTAEGKIAQDTAKQTGQPVDPFYQLPQPYQKVILTISSLPPGSSDKSQLTQSNQNWLSEYYKAKDAYFKQLNLPQQQTGKPQVTPDLQKKLDYYYSLPSGTGARTQFANANPDLVDYFNKSKDYTNQQRSDLGLQPIQPYSSKSSFKPYVHKVSTKLKHVKVPSITFPKVKAPKIKPLTLKVKPYKYAKIHVPKINYA